MTNEYKVQTFEDMNREAYEAHNKKAVAEGVEYITRRYGENVQIKKDSVAHQSHYVSDGVEPIDLIRSLGILAPFCQGNIIKYTARYDKKNGLEDLKKAQVYLGWLIELVEGE